MKKVNPMIGFYLTVFNYLVAPVEEVGAVEEILTLSDKALPSWEADEESVMFLEKCCNRNSSVTDEEEWSATIINFMKAAFKDLSVLKDPEAMRVFTKLACQVSATFNAGDDMLIWARDIKLRDDGSAVVILHVSDIERFRILIEEHDLADSSSYDGNTLEEGVIIGS